MPLGIYNSNAFKNVSGAAQIAASANVEVRRESDSALASIFSDRAGTTPIVQVAYPGTNGFKTGANGDFQFFAAGLSGGYQVRVYTDDLTLDKTLRYQRTGTAGELDADPFWAAVLATATAAAARLALGFAAIAAKGDSWWGSAADTVVKVAVGANGTIPMARSAATPGIAYVAALSKAIYGLTYDNGTDATNDLNINTGGAMDATGAYWMTLASALGKQSDVAWAVGGTTGAPAGGLDTGAVGNSDYYIWLIARSDTGVVDVLFSLSSTAPTMPANYDFKRLIGWFKRVGGTVVAFTTYETEGGGLELLWASPTLDVDLVATLTTSRRTDAVKVPLNFSTIVKLNGYTDHSAAYSVWVYCPDQTDLAPSFTAAPLNNLGNNAAAATATGELNIRTRATGTVAARGSTATINNYRLSTMGFTWARRN